eukprot:COSAG01_NODE_4162_length_5279_cov_33.245560_1_plen_480_part_00
MINPPLLPALLPLLLLLLLLLLPGRSTDTRASSALSPLWRMSASASGAIRLDFYPEETSKRETPLWTSSHATAATLRGGCPALVVPPATDTISLCSPLHYRGAAVSARAPGFDPVLGAYNETVISYRPRRRADDAAITAAAAAPAVDCVVQIFGRDQPGARVVLLQLRLLDPVTTNRLEVLTGASWSLLPSRGEGGSDVSEQGAGRLRVLSVPHDNDLQSMYTSADVSELAQGTSCYVSAMYQDGEGNMTSNSSSPGLVAGFLEHDLWKSGVEYGPGQRLSAVAGLNGALITRDILPHGVVAGARTSPLLSIGMYPDWREGMEAFATMQRGHRLVVPPAPAAPPSRLAQAQAQAQAQELLLRRPPSGWNSWALSAAHLGAGQPTPANLALRCHGCAVGVATRRRIWVPRWPTIYCEGCSIWIERKRDTRVGDTCQIQRQRGWYIRRSFCVVWQAWGTANDRLSWQGVRRHIEARVLGRR